MLRKVLIGVVCSLIIITSQARAQEIFGKWKCIGHYKISADGKKIDIWKAHLKTSPCAALTIYDFKQDGREIRMLKDCEESYSRMQHKLWKNWRFRIVENQVFTFVSNHIGEMIYTIRFQEDKMIWTNTDENLIFQRL